MHFQVVRAHILVLVRKSTVQPNLGKNPGKLWQKHMVSVMMIPAVEESNLENLQVGRIGVHPRLARSSSCACSLRSRPSPNCVSRSA